MTNWITGNIIRNKSTGSPYIIVAVFGQSLLIVDAKENGPAQVLVLLQRDYDHFVPDMDMELNVKKNNELEDTIKFTFKPFFV